MRNIYLVLAILTFMGSSIYIICKRKINHSNPDNHKTKIAIFKKLIDIGDKPIKASAMGKYMIYNSGSNDLFVKSVIPDCHCTVSEFSKEPVKPGDSIAVVLRYDSTRIGVFQSSALVETNSDQTPLLLVLRGNMVDLKNK